MEIFVPRYYREFHCVASACPDSCCKEWDVTVDPASAARYRALPGELGDALRAALLDEDGETVMVQQDGRCPMWRDDGLCRIQAQLGEHALCQVCRDFPRLRHDYGDFVELGLELSCPEAARLIFSAAPEAPIRSTLPGGSQPEYDAPVMDTLRRSRGEILALLQNSSLPIQHLLAVMLLYGYAVQEEIDGGEAAALDPKTMLAEARSLAQPGDIRGILDFYGGLEILTDTWRSRLSTPLPVPRWDDALRPLARYAVERYWLQAVCDYDLVSRVKFIILTCTVVSILGGDTLGTAQLYSKEIENDADNMDAILDGAYTSPALTDVKLLGLLLEE